MKLAIIGTAGRKSDAERLDINVWRQMRAITQRFIKQQEGLKSLISGGAAWADHLAVDAFLCGHCPALTICLPCKWDSEQMKFYDTRVFDWRINPGGTSNHYHRKFSLAIKENSLIEIHNAINLGAEVIVEHGFKERNSLVARADILLAFTYGNKQIVKDGGTKDTVAKYLDYWKEKSRAFHCDLNSMEIYPASL